MRMWLREVPDGLRVYSRDSGLLCLQRWPPALSSELPLCICWMH